MSEQYMNPSPLLVFLKNVAKQSKDRSLLRTLRCAHPISSMPRVIYSVRPTFLSQSGQLMLTTFF